VVAQPSGNDVRSTFATARPLSAILSYKLGMMAHGRKNVFSCGWGDLLAGVIFAMVALFHLVRIFMEWTVIIGDWSIPMWVSWIALVVAGGLALLGLRLSER